jgi:hypothetical protein
MPAGARQVLLACCVSAWCSLRDVVYVRVVEN